jgi:hypothetical protein
MKNKVHIESIDIPKNKLEILKGLIEKYDAIDTEKGSYKEKYWWSVLYLSGISDKRSNT